MREVGWQRPRTLEMETGNGRSLTRPVTTLYDPFFPSDLISPVSDTAGNDPLGLHDEPLVSCCRQRMTKVQAVRGDDGSPQA